jgi:hypothetical protein
LPAKCSEHVCGVTYSLVENPSHPFGVSSDGASVGAGDGTDAEFVSDGIDVGAGDGTAVGLCVVAEHVTQHSSSAMRRAPTIIPPPPRQLKEQVSVCGFSKN